MEKPFILGLTGGIACGKSTVAHKLEQLGAVHIDADAVSRVLTGPEGPALEKIREVFGDEVFHEDGTLDRRALGEIVFGDEASRRALEGILHPMIQHGMLQQADKAGLAGEKVCVFNVPLLYETGMDAMCDEVWVMTLPEDKQLIRLMHRDALTREEALARIRSQMPMADKEALASAVFRTDKPEADTLREVEHRYRDLLKQIERR
ncbi:MAG: dephospho-CoA kinase [Eubacteriales bacterium]|nr:dephospho-CoA kinase [Eubacteriales bacterium]